MKIYLDDEREAPPSWYQTYTVEETITQILLGGVEELSLDHDLGEGLKTGYDLCKWIEEKVFSNPDFPLPIIHIHSANAAGRQNMLRAIGSINRIKQSQQGETP